MTEYNFLTKINDISLLYILRPKQWYKNLLVFVPLIYGLQIFHLNLDVVTLIGFSILCMSSSGSYIVNDLIDYNIDKHHPEKIKRSSCLPNRVSINAFSKRTSFPAHEKK